ncbi:MAG: RluA family pseudouridine synthase [Eubacterium sp.]|nr:RluA family pseudouridine synthase [Eubacterium sp.]
MIRKYIYKAGEKDDGRKISSYLKDRGYSARILTTLRHTEGSIFLNGTEVHMNEMLSPGDEVEVVLAEKASDKVIPTEIPLNIIYEDDDILVVNKPYGMPSHPSRGVAETTLGNAIEFYLEKKGQAGIYRCVNRLDKDTSGLTIIAKNPLSGAVLYELVKNREVKRTYFAIAVGIFDEKEGRIDLPICRKEEGSQLRCVDRKNGVRAVTNYRVIKEGKTHSLIELSLETGRTHQIRVHMSYIGHPLEGDALYNPNKCRMKRHALHAGKLAFEHPITKEKLLFEADMPDDMKEFIKDSFEEKR